MKESSNLDTGFEGHLRQSLEGRLTRLPSDGAAGDCLDEETLAAWADHALDARERAAVEAHAADCSRCQGLLAAMARTAQPAEEVKTAWWRGTTVKWWATLTASAVALLVWAALPNRHLGRTTDRREPALTLPSRASAPPSGRLQAGESRRVPEGQSAHERTLTKPVQTRRDPSDTAKAPGPARPEALASGAPQADAVAARPQDAGDAAALTPAPFRLQNFTSVRRESVAVEEIISPDPSTRWRIVPGGAVQRSTDGGSTWQLQQPDAGVALVAGASPAPLVCWLVGRGGVVWLQTDGSTWRRIGFPEQVDLTSIQATDGRTATITTSDGRAFQTADGGLTWALVRQE